MATHLIQSGKKVIIVGRTESTVSSVSREIGATDSYVLDTGDLPSIPPFITKVLSDHPDLDCLINNAGVQTPLQVLGPDYDFDLSKADQEIDINIRGPLHLSTQLINHFNKLPNGGVIMNVSSSLGFNPISYINPVYCGTKAWLHFFTMNLRTQLSKAGSQIRVIEIVPPMVETDLHRDRKDPDDNKGGKAMKVDDFMKAVVQGWEADQDVIAPGMAADGVRDWYTTFGGSYEDAVKMR